MRGPGVWDEHDVLIDHSRLSRNEQVRRHELQLCAVMLYQFSVNCSQNGTDHGCKRGDLCRFVRGRRHVRHLFGSLVAQQVSGDYRLRQLDCLSIAVITLCSCFRRVGYRLAKGESLSAILGSMDGVSEGVSTVLALEELIKRRVRPNIYEFKFPIMASIAQIIRGNITPELGLNVLMRYPIRDESRSSAAPK